MKYTATQLRQIANGIDRIRKACYVIHFKDDLTGTYFSTRFKQPK